MFCEGNPVVPVDRDLAHSPLATASSTISESHTSYPVSTVHHSCKAHGKSSHSECTKLKPTTAHEVPGSVSSAHVTPGTTTVTIIRTVYPPHSTRSTHRSHKASSSHKSHSIHSTHISHSAHTTQPHHTASGIHTIKVTQTVTYQPSSHSHIKSSTTTTKAGASTSSQTSSVKSSLSSSTSHSTVPSYGSSSQSSSSASKASTPLYTITPVLLPSGHSSSLRSSNLLTTTTHSPSPTKVIQPPNSSLDITTHLKSTVYITSVITVAPSSFYTTSTSTTRSTHPIALARAVNNSSSLKAKVKDIITASSAVMVAVFAAGFVGVI